MPLPRRRLAPSLGGLSLLLALARCGPPGPTSGAADSGRSMDATAGASTPCRSDRECSPSGRVCDRARGVCAQCVSPADCAMGQQCMQGSCVAVRACTSSRMCPGQVCDMARGYCVDCVEDVDCPSADRCLASRCVPRPTPCRSDRECTAMGKVCDPGRMVCVECVRPEDCPTGTFCGPDALCLAQACAPASRSCADEGRVRECNAQGSSFVDSPCAEGTRCLEGVCAAAPMDALAPDATEPADVVSPPDVVAPPDEPAPPDVVPPPDARVLCSSDLVCDNGQFCDGVERCLPTDPRADGRGCVPAPASPCAAGEACSEAQRRCVPMTVSCTAPMADCDGTSSNGCETDLRSSAAHCGACGAACRGLGGACVASACDRVSEVNGYLYEVCARRSGGAVLCWTAGRTDLRAVPGLAGAAQLAVGSYVRCARLESGGVRCWGDNERGQLGNGATSMTPVTTPVDVLELRDARSVVAGEDFFCALRATSEVVCWGAGDRGQLGNGAAADSSRPVTVSGLRDVVQLAAGRYHACARLRDGTLRCWGENLYRQLGDGTDTRRLTPVAVAGVSGAVELAVGNYTGYAHTATSVLAWGYNANGQVGDGTTMSAATPRAVLDLPASSVRELTAGLLHTCALLNDGTARCWGGNLDRQLGDGTNASRSRPVPFTAPAGIQQLAAGLTFTCARYGDGAVRCWGRAETPDIEVANLR